MNALAPLLLALIASAALAGPPADEVAVGQPYPALRLPTIDGRETLSLGELHGQKVLLIEFAAW